jgi:hypothetical protein
VGLSNYGRRVLLESAGQMGVAGVEQLAGDALVGYLDRSYCSQHDVQQRVDRGSMQMVQRHMIYLGSARQIYGSILLQTA